MHESYTPIAIEYRRLYCDIKFMWMVTIAEFQVLMDLGSLSAQKTEFILILNKKFN